MKPTFIIHGGAGAVYSSADRKQLFESTLAQIRDKTQHYFDTHSALDTVQYAVELMEDCELFNAGTGSKIQQDGHVRMSASIMSGEDLSYGAIINVQYIQHPIIMARHLMHTEDCVQDTTGSEALKITLSLPYHNPITPYRLKQYEKLHADKYGTVGAVAVDRHGHLAAATSTGGRGFEAPGRVSDTAMPSSTYATRDVAISCTGIGEQIVRHSPAVKLAAWMQTDPSRFEDYIQHLKSEALALQFEYGFIAITPAGKAGWMYTTPQMIFITSL